MPAAAIINCIFFCGSKKARIERGASFCQVDRIKQEVQEIEAITEGYQKWHGTLPSFSSREVVKRMGRIFGVDEKGIHNEELEVRRSAEPRAWARKYFTDPSTS